MTVSVARTGQSARTDGAGRFALGDLPSGPVVLNFQGNGVKGAATLSLAAGATARVTIPLTNGRSTVSIDPRSDNVALEGTVGSVNPGAASFVLVTNSGSPVIQTNSSTLFAKGGAPGSFADLQPGSEVYLYGTRQSDGSILAAKVYIDPPRPTPTATQTKTETTPTVTRTPSSVVALEGVVLSIDAGNGRFVIQTNGGPVTIQTNTATEFRKGDAPVTFGDLAVGGEVYLYGNRQNDGSVLALKVYIEVPNPTPTVTRTRTEPTPTPTVTRTKTEMTPTPTRTVSQQVILYGLVLSLDSANGRFVIQTDGGPVTIQTNSATEYVKDNLPASFGDLVVGGGVYAAGTRQNDGSLLASRIIFPKTPTSTPTRTATHTETTPTRTRTPSG